MEEITKYVEYLFALALKKCGDINVAEDLAQDTLLAAVQHRRRGGEMSNVKYWLTSTLSHKWNDYLRAKYKLPTVSVDVLPETADEEYEPDDSPTGEEVRREVAYLASLQRTVIVKHYLEGKRVDTIARELGIPRGTVLSRLSAGREQMRKGFETMEQYEKQSHTPERLEITCSGRPGFYNRPFSLVADDAVKQNILLMAYESPATVTEIARALGIPTPYVELAVENLLEAQLMRKVGKRVATDFLITAPSDHLKSLARQLAIADGQYDAIWHVITDLFAALKDMDWYNALLEIEQCDLGYYAMLAVLSGGTRHAKKRVVGDVTKDEYPSRNDGGNWIAQGERTPIDFNYENHPLRQYRYGGEHRVYTEKYLDTKFIELRVYDTQPDLTIRNHGPVEISDYDLALLLYYLYTDPPMDNPRTPFEAHFYKDIPHLIQCGILKRVEDKVKVEIPVIAAEQSKELLSVTDSFIWKMADLLESPIRTALPELKQKIPAHLRGRIAEHRLYSVDSIPMAVLKRATAQGDFRLPETGKALPMFLAVQE
ncbi:MAG: sigma-70 family RNA polymerase sigma factor [Clostridia bacterium]|nr:sigma-70 family RNA polymerase sigma factor [Clostridia bacterium]